MKKFLFYSTIFTVLVLVFGILFIYGVFDVSQGQSRLIGSLHASSEMDVHNQIVEYVHDIGISTSDGWNNFNSLTPESDLTAFRKAISDTKRKKDDLSKYIEAHTFSKKGMEIKNTFNESYQPALEKWLNSFSKTNAFFEEQPVTEENVNSFKGMLSNAHQAFIEAHNAYTEVLNSTRKY